MTEGLGDWVAPGRVALLIVDTQVDFALPSGAMGRAGLDLSTVPAALAAAGRLADAARAAGVPVIFAGLQTAAETDSPIWAERLRRLGGEGAGGAGVCRAGEVGADFVGPTPRSGELVVAKTRYSAFHGTGLAEHLRGRGLDTLVVCGLTTECCVDCTVRDAFHADFHVFVAADACAAYEPDLHAVALKALSLNCAIIATSGQIDAAWAAAGLGR